MDVAGLRAEENKRRAPGRSQTAFSALQVQCINRCTTRAVGRGSCFVTAIMPPSVFWVAQLVERQTVIATRLLSEGPWFEPMSRSFCFLMRPGGRSGWSTWRRSIYTDTTHDQLSIRRKNSIGVIISDFHHGDSTSSMYSEDACSSHASFTFCSARRG